MRNYLNHSCLGILKGIIGIMLAGAATFLLVDRLFPFRPNIPYATQVTAAEGELLYAFLSKDEKWRLYAGVDEITPLLRQTLLYKEDKYFYRHPGVNPLAVWRAFGTNLLKGRRTSGASTITMQVARLLEPRPRTYRSKLIEILHALQLEWHYSKPEILQLYCNLIPFGGNIEGIKAASLLYYGKPPQLLSLSEITTLTIIPNQPNRLQPGKNNPALLQQRDHWLRAFEKSGLFPAGIVQDALREPVAAYRRQLPRNAPHLSRRLQQSHEGQLIHTTLSAHRQSRTEKLVANYVSRIQALNIHNAAVIVVNNATMAVEAYVGSADFNNPEDGGQVDGVRAVRSPGSTLKPLLYATAFDNGLVTPKTVLNDVPTNFGGYQPENFDLRFNGPVTVEFALANSLNIPAVKLLQELQTPAFVSQLKKAGFKTIEQQAGGLGLSLILGGCGVSLEELTRLFATFARGGQLHALRFVETPESPGTALVSPAAAYLITDMLSQPNRPDLPNHFDNTYRLPKIAWKTGTSYGKRDAWSIGYNQHYTIGVWIGNFSGAGVPELSGANIATPLLFEIFNTLDYNNPSRPQPFPAGLQMRKVCAVSGDLPAVFCEQQITGYFLPGISPHKRCQHKKWVFTNPQTTLSYCTYCLPATGYVKQLFPNLAPELIAFYNNARVPYPKLPPHNPACDRVFTEGAPLIVSPLDGAEYYVFTDDSQQLQLRCHAALDVDDVYWFVNDKPLQTASPQEPVFFQPSPGRLKISCSDDKGRTADIHILVKRL